MKIQALVCPLLVAIAVLAQEQLCAQAANRAAPHNTHCTVQKEEIEILADYLKGEALPHDLTVLVTKTESTHLDVDTVNLQLAVKGRGIPPEVRTDFKVKNKSSCAIEPFAGITNLRFISNNEYDQMFRAGWSEFHKRYGKHATIVLLSRVGFNSDKTLALLHVSSGIGPMAGGGILYLFERKEGKWLIKSYIETWTT